MMQYCVINVSNGLTASVRFNSQGYTIIKKSITDKFKPYLLMMTIWCDHYPIQCTV